MKFNTGSFSQTCKFWLYLANGKAHLRPVLHVLWPSTVSWVVYGAFGSL